MKKFVIAVALVCTAALMTACGDKEACYEVTVSATIFTEKVEQTIKVYGTESEVDSAIEEVKQTMSSVMDGLADLQFDIDRHKVNASEEDCR